MKRFKTIYLVIGIFAWSAINSLPAMAGDNYQEKLFAQCGDTAPYGTAPRFELDYLNWEEAGLVGLSMSYLSFQSEAGKPTIGTQVGCKIQQVQLLNGILTAGGPLPGCYAKIIAEKKSDSQLYTIAFSNKPLLHNCTLSNSPEEIILILKAIDPTLFENLPN